MNAERLYTVLRGPHVSEKAAMGESQVVFKVAVDATKLEVKKAVEKLFKVNVIKVNIMNTKTKKKIKQGKLSKKPGYKKAIITLKKGQSIDLTTGI